MFRPQCRLAIFALLVGVAQSWDIAITTGDQLAVYTNKTKINSVGIGRQYADLTALAYDAVHNMLLFVDKRNENASIFSYHLATNKYQSLVSKTSSEGIHGIAFDPVNSLLFWTDTLERTISTMSLKPGSNDSAYGNLWLKLHDQIPRGIAIDSCRGYVYWTNTYTPKATIERARLDGSDRRIIVSTNVHMPVSLAIDQRTKRLYWVDDQEGIFFSIESSDLDGNNRTTHYKGVHHQPNALTVSNGSVYWVDWIYKTVWKLPKNAQQDKEPEQYIKLNEAPFGIAARYLIQDQTEGIPECKGLSSLSQDKSAINESFSAPSDMGLFCVHGKKDDNKLECKCTAGYIGDRCDISVCHNFCFQGDCSITDDGQPTCRCKSGFSGDRCEVNVCTGFCLNNGDCSLNEEHEPVCTCIRDFKGKRCETEMVIATTVGPTTEKTVPTTETTTFTIKPMPTNAPTICNCTSNDTKVAIHPSEQPSATDGEFVMTTSCYDDWDKIRDPIIMVLGILVGLLVLACVVLFTKILQLKKRPRIKKRIIVNKNVTPLTARPDQCEITIENCCNMNICETPCFEPRSTIRPTLLGAKAGKDEKKNLIANMELPDDY